MARKNMILFIAVYAAATLVISQNSLGVFFVSVTANGETTTAVTNAEDIFETINECLGESADGECTVAFMSDLLRKTVTAE
jgi:hypothetical protein